MSVLRLDSSISDQLAQSLGRFERQFAYPLTAGRRFRIDHGQDYLGFYRSMGEACGFVALKDEEVVGVVCGAIRELRGPDEQAIPSLYVGDLKVSPRVNQGRVLLRLMAELERWAAPRVERAYGVVMAGTARTPEAYTGRLGVPRFEELARLALVRVEVPTKNEAPDCDEVSVDRVWTRFIELSQQCYRQAKPAHFEVRSSIEPIGIMHPSGDACAILEDTRNAKRLFDMSGAEIVSAHLSAFAFDDVGAARELLFAALKRCRQLSIPALFLTLPVSVKDDILSEFDDTRSLATEAIVYGAGFAASSVWNIDTAEI